MICIVLYAILESPFKVEKRSEDRKCEEGNQLPASGVPRVLLSEDKRGNRDRNDSGTVCVFLHEK